MNRKRDGRRTARRRWTFPAVALSLTVLLAGSSVIFFRSGETASPPGLANTSPPAGRYFVDAAQTTGIVHRDVLRPSVDPTEDWTAGGGVAIGDVDHDGHPDVYLTALNGPNRLFRNLGNGTFEDISKSWGAEAAEDWTLGATFADYDGDGDPDLFLANRGPDRLLRNDGAHFTDVSTESGFHRDGRSSSVALADYDGDGDLDAYVTSWFQLYGPRMSFWQFLPWADASEMPEPDPRFTVEVDRLYRNEGDGTFTDVSDLLPAELRAAPSFVAGWSDLDDDGDPDLYVVNDFGPVWLANQLYRNDGPGPGGRWNFTPVSDECGCALAGSGMGVAIGDVDRDGRQDLYVTNMLWQREGGDGEHLIRNLGDLLFEDRTNATAARAASHEQRRIISWGAELLDVDNDGWLDLYVPFGHMPPDETPDVKLQPNALLMNHAGHFELESASGAEDTRWSRGVGVVDLEGDGCLDLVVANLGHSAGVFQNRCDSGHHWLQLDLVGSGLNRDAVGAVAWVTADGVTQRREVFAGSTSVHSSPWKVLHFGLGPATRIERIDIRWPSGQTRRLEDLPVDRRLRIEEPTH